MAHREKPLQFVKVRGANLSSVVPGTSARGRPAVIKHFEGGDKYYTENLSFPLNVEGDSQEGHYIIFTVKEQNKAKLTGWKPRQGKTRAEIAKEVAGAARPPMTHEHINKEIDRQVAELAIVDADKADFDKLTHSKAGFNNSIQLAKNATTDLKATISIYMPASVKVSYTTKYAEEEIGLLAETGAAAIKSFMETEGSTVEALFAGGKEALEGAGQGLKQWGTKALDSMAKGSAALIAISRGKIITPRMELMFDGVGRREFSYDFTFIPKSEKEADSIEGIVTRFKHAMAADYSTGNIAGVDFVGSGAGADGVREMDIPSFFDITYMYKGKENNHLNKISTCVLTKMDVTYGADRFKTYRGGVPQTTQISLSFSELNIITKSHIEQGY